MQGEDTIEQRHEIMKARDGLKRSSSDLAMDLRKVNGLPPAKKRRVMAVVGKCLHQMVEASRPGANTTTALLNIINLTKK